MYGVIVCDCVLLHVIVCAKGVSYICTVDIPIMFLPVMFGSSSSW